MRYDNDISYADLEAIGWPHILIDDYIGRLRELTPQQGVDADPNGIYIANRNGFYYDTNLGVMWYNPTPGANSGWTAV